MSLAQSNKRFFGGARSASPEKTTAIAVHDIWRDDNGPAEVCGLVNVEGTLYAVMIRISSQRLRRPFLFPARRMMLGDDGWRRTNTSNETTTEPTTS